MKTKRFAASLIALCIFIMACSTTFASMAFAESTVTGAGITITNTSSTTGISMQGKSFAVYEVFTATIDDSKVDEAGNPTIAYTVTEDFAPYFLDKLTAESDTTYGTYNYTAYKTALDGETTNPSASDILEAVMNESSFHLDAYDYVESYTENMDDLVALLRTYALTDPDMALDLTWDVMRESGGVETISTAASTELLGYYLVLDSTNTSAENVASDVIMAGALVTVPTRSTENTFTSNATINIKASAPTIIKEVWHNDISNTNGDLSPIYEKGGSWDYVADYAVGDTVEFRLTLTLPSNLDGYDSYTYNVTDIPDNGLSINYDSIAVYTDASLSGTTTGDKHEKSQNDDGGFTLSFDMLEIKSEVGSAISKFYVYYTATIEEDLIVAQEYETNTATLTYSINPYDAAQLSTIEDTVYLYTFELDVLKTSGDATTPLAGAIFALYEKSIDGTASSKQIYLETLIDADNQQVFADDSNGNPTIPVYYTIDKTASDVVTEPGTAPSGAVITDDTGRFIIIGLDDATTYSLVEIAAPNGYNAADPIDFTLIAVYPEDDGTAPELTLSTVTGSDITATNNVLSTTVVNTSSALLPITGGVGTTVLTYGGIILMIGAATAMIIKRKKM